MHATILAYMFRLVEQGSIQVPLGHIPDNALYIHEFVASLLRAAFPHLNDHQIQVTVKGLFDLNQNIPGFKEHLRDFLVQIRVRFECLFNRLFIKKSMPLSIGIYR